MTFLSNKQSDVVGQGRGFRWLRICLQDNYAPSNWLRIWFVMSLLKLVMSLPRSLISLPRSFRSLISPSSHFRPGALEGSGCHEWRTSS
jgi:hypothetical protein